MGDFDNIIIGTGKAVGTGICFCVMFWLVFDSIALGIGLGVAMGAAISQTGQEKRDNPKPPEDNNQ